MTTSVLTLPSHMSGFLHQLGNHQSGVFSYVSYPSAILPTNRSNMTRSSSNNIMHDRRVVRGNTYALTKANVIPTEEAIARQREAVKRNYLKKRVLPNINGCRLTDELSADKNGVRATMGRVRVRKRSERPPNGRKHCDIQTDVWLEEIQDRVLETEVGIQTSPTEEEEIEERSRPQSLPTMAFSTTHIGGVDKSTQILPDDPDLFVFEEEVVIVLEALVGKTLEQSLLEVLEEEELASITQQKLTFETKKIIALNN